MGDVGAVLRFGRVGGFRSLHPIVCEGLKGHGFRPSGITGAVGAESSASETVRDGEVATA